MESPCPPPSTPPTASVCWPAPTTTRTPCSARTRSPAGSPSGRCARTPGGHRRRGRTCASSCTTTATASSPGCCRCGPCPRYRLRVAYEATVAGDRRPVPLPARARQLDLHLIGEGRHEELWQALGARPMTHQGVDRHPVHGVGAERAGRAASPAPSTSGTARATRCARSAPPASGSCSCPASARASCTSSRSPAPDGSRTMRADPLARRTEVPPATVVRRARLAATRGATQEWLARRGDAPAHEAPFSVYEVHLAVLAAGPDLPPARRAAPGVRHGTRLHPRRADAGRRAPLRRLLGLPGHRLLRARRPGSAPPTTSSTWWTRCTRPASAS